MHAKESGTNMEEDRVDPLASRIFVLNETRLVTRFSMFNDHPFIDYVILLKYRMSFSGAKMTRNIDRITAKK